MFAAQTVTMDCHDGHSSSEKYLCFPTVMTDDADPPRLHHFPALRSSCRLACRRHVRFSHPSHFGIRHGGRAGVPLSADLESLPAPVSVWGRSGWGRRNRCARRSACSRNAMTICAASRAASCPATGCGCPSRMRCARWIAPGRCWRNPARPGRCARTSSPSRAGCISTAGCSSRTARPRRGRTGKRAGNS